MLHHHTMAPLLSYNHIFIRLRYHCQVKKSGEIVDDNSYRLKMAKKEHQKHVRDLLATAIVHKALDIEVSINFYIFRCQDSSMVRFLRIDLMVSGSSPTSAKISLRMRRVILGVRIALW